MKWAILYNTRSSLQRGIVDWAKEKAGSALDWVKDKAGKAKDWACDKLQGVSRTQLMSYSRKNILNNLYRFENVCLPWQYRRWGLCQKSTRYNATKTLISRRDLSQDWRARVCLTFWNEAANRMAWQWAETLVEIMGTLADIRWTTK